MGDVIELRPKSDVDVSSVELTEASIERLGPPDSNTYRCTLKLPSCFASRYVVCIVEFGQGTGPLERHLMAGVLARLFQHAT